MMLTLIPHTPHAHRFQQRRTRVTTLLLIIFASLASLISLAPPMLAQTPQTSMRTLRGLVQTATPTGQTVALAGIPVVTTVVSGTLTSPTTRTDTLLTNNSGEYTLALTVTDPVQSVTARPLGVSVALPAPRPALQFSPAERSLSDAMQLSSAEIVIAPFLAQTFSVAGSVRLSATPDLAQLTREVATVTAQLLSGTPASVVAETTVQFVAGGALQRPFVFNNVLPGRYTLRTSFPRDSALQISPRDTSFALGNADLGTGAAGASTALVVNAVPVLPRIVGVVTFQGRPRPNTPVQIFLGETNTIMTTLTASDGSYSFTVATSGTWSVSIPIVGIPAFRIATVNWLRGPLTARADLDAEPTRYAITGTVNYDDQATSFVPMGSVATIRALSGVLPTLDTTIALVGGTSNGMLVLNARLPLGRYQITLAGTGAVFTPQTFTIQVTDQGAVLPAITAIPRYQTISGIVNEATNGTVRAVPGFTVSASSVGGNGATRLLFATTATTGADGRYTFRVPFSTYIVFINNRLNPLYEALPPNNYPNVLINGNDITLQPFVVVRTPPRPYAVTGLTALAAAPQQAPQQVPPAAPRGVFSLPGVVGAALEGVRLQAIQQGNGQVLSNSTSDANGRYTLAGVTSGTYIIRPVLTGFVFTPTERVVSVIDNNTTAPSFTATLAPTVFAGSIKTIREQGVGDVPVRVRVSRVNDEASLLLDSTIQANFQGNYSLTLEGLLPNQRITFTPQAALGVPSIPAMTSTMTSTIFAPPTRLVVAEPSLRAPAGSPAAAAGFLSLPEQNFRTLSTTGSVRLGTIVGQLVPSVRTQPVEGTVITDGTRSAVADDQGNFVIRNVPNGTYRLAVLKQGYRFRDPGAVVVSGLQQQRLPLVIFVFDGSTVNRPPVITRLPGNPAGTLRLSVGRPQLFRTSVADLDSNDILSASAIVEDPTIARVRLGRDSLIIDPLFEGNTAVTYIAHDNQGGFTTATVRVFVEPALDPPTTLVRAEPFNTNHNAAFVITREAVRRMIAQSIAAQTGSSLVSPKDIGLVAVGVGDELGAFNTRDECVGSVRLSGDEDVLTVWSEEPDSKVAGMLPNTKPRYELAATNPKRRTRTSAVYLLGDPGAGPLDRATIVSLTEALGSSVNTGSGGANTPNTMTGTSVQNSALAGGADAPRLAPNPTSSDFTLDYALESRTTLRCDLLNNYGQLIDTLVDAEQAPGRYRLRVNTSDLPSGLYLCRLQAGATFTTLRVMVIR
jgi:hypothetical protein